MRYHERFSAQVAAVEHAMRLLVADFGDPMLVQVLRKYLGLDGRTDGEHSRRLRGVLHMLAHTVSPCGQTRCNDVGAAIELVHNASLIIDDVQDGHEVRWGRPALWVDVGIAQSVNVALLLFLAAQRTIAAAGLRLLQQFQARIGVMIQGQMQDVALREERVDGRRDFDGYVRLAEAKTASLFIAAAELGSHASDDRLSGELIRYARLLGISHQIHDDLDDLEDRAQPRAASWNNVASHLELEVGAVPHAAQDAAQHAIDEWLREIGFVIRGLRRMEALGPDAVSDLEDLASVIADRRRSPTPA